RSRQSDTRFFFRSLMVGSAIGVPTARTAPGKALKNIRLKPRLQQSCQVLSLDAADGTRNTIARAETKARSALNRLPFEQTRSSRYIIRLAKDTAFFQRAGNVRPRFRQECFSTSRTGGDFPILRDRL